MEGISPSAARMIWIWLLATLFAIQLGGCGSIRFVSDYDAQAAKDLADTSELMFAFYDKLAENRAASSKLEYAPYSPDWGKVEVRLRVLLLREQSRPLNQDSTEIVAATLQQWEKYRDAHRRTNDYTLAKIRIDRNHMARNLGAAMNTEKAKQLGKAADTPPAE